MPCPLVIGYDAFILGRLGADALAYSNVLFGGAILIWSFNVLAAVVRGSGNMLLPSLTLLGTAPAVFTRR